LKDITYSDYNIEYSHIYLGEGQKLIGESELEGIRIAKSIVRHLEKHGKSCSLCVLIDDYSNSHFIDIDRIHSEMLKTGLTPDFYFYESFLAGETADCLIESIPKKYIKSENENVTIRIDDTSSIRVASSKNSVRSKILDELSKEQKVKQFNGVRDLLLAKLNDEFIEEQSLNYDNIGIRRTSSASLTEVILKTYSESGERYSCPLLDAAWHLTRLGIQPYSEQVENLISYSDKPFFGKKLITILPSGYLRVESTAMEIIGMLKRKTIRKRRRNIKYYFY